MPVDPSIAVLLARIDLIRAELEHGKLKEAQIHLETACYELGYLRIQLAKPQKPPKSSQNPSATALRVI